SDGRLTGRPGARRRASALFAQAELLHLRLEALAGDLEEPRGVGDVTARLLERAHDELALDAARGLADGLLEAGCRPVGVLVRLVARLGGEGRQRRRGRDRRDAHLRREIAGVDSIAVAEEEAALDHVLELADV